MEALREKVYDESINYLKEKNLKPSKHLDFIHFRLDSPNLTLEQALLAFPIEDEKK